MFRQLSKATFVAAVAALILGVSTQSATAAAYNPPVEGSVELRLVSPVLNGANSVDLTSSAKGDWDQYYGAGLRFKYFYADVRGSLNLTYKVTNAAGSPLANRTVYLIVNKAFSCSKTTFSTPQETNYPGGNRPNSNAIVRDWCGDQPQLGAGETAVIATTDQNGEAVFNLLNYNKTGEAYPKAKNAVNDYIAGVQCADDDRCMATTITASMVAHPSTAFERTEDKDLLAVHFVNPKLSVNAKKLTASSSKKVTLSYKLTRLNGTPASGVTVVFDSWGEGNDPAKVSAVSDSKGVVKAIVSAERGTKGLQVFSASIYGSPAKTKTKIYWK